MPREKGSARPGGVVHFPTLSADTFAEAVCHQDGPDLWEPARDDEPDRVARARWREAAELCGYCPALAACARLADSQESLAGVWAGRVPRIPGERITAGLGTGCGSRAGFQHHKRLKEKPCARCESANNDYMREYMAARRSR